MEQDLLNCVFFPKMEINTIKQDKGVAGLTILLSVIVMLFVIGLLVMIFALMSARMIVAIDDGTAGGNVSVRVINGTSTSLSGVIDWFPLFIVITAMVVLILLTVIIITTIRSSGLMGQGGA